MSHYILVHGAWEESGMWDEVSPILRQNGHTVTAIDLPGHGANKQPDSVVTTTRYVQAVVNVINSLDYPVILAAHSMSGALISQVAEQIPENIERLVYVTAFLLASGESVLEAMEGDADGQVMAEIVFSDDQALVTLPEPALRRIGFHDVDAKEIERILPMMGEWQATEPFMSKVVLSEENFGSVPKTYIRTNIDRMISPAQQNAMIANWEVDTVFDLKSGHFPTSSVPSELAEVLLRAAGVEKSERVSNA
jgi:pimeloyl-ACP methyl ester carboxylesterase